MKRDLAAEIDGLRANLRIMEGEALFASNLLGRLLLGMVGKSVLTKQDAAKFVDETLYIMERLDPELTAAGLSTERARARLQGLLTSLAKLA